MRFLLSLFLVATCAVAAVPQAIVTISSATAQTNVPVSLSYVFAPGDIRYNARPYVNGVAVNPWQCDPKTRHRDDRITHNITSVSNTEPIYVTFGGPHGFRTGEIVTIASVGGTTSANGTWRIQAFSRTKIVLLGSSGDGVYTSGGTATGPDLGSLKHAMISFKIPSISAGGSVTVTFRNSVDQCSSGDASACNSAALDADGMAAFNSGNWNVRLETTASSITHQFADAKTMIAAGKFEYWLRGPAATMVIARDNSSGRAYDKGYTCLTNCTTDHSTATWSDDGTHKALHPTYQLTFYPGWSGVKADYIMENTWLTFSKPQRYSWAAKSGTSFATTEASGAEVTHYQGSRWRVTAWDGSQPDPVGIDRNRRYLQWACVIPNYPIVNSTTSTDKTNLYNRISSADYTPLSGTGRWNTYFPATGGREDLGMLPSWYVTFLMGDFPVASEPYILKLGDMSGHVDEGRNYDSTRVHLRESVTSSYYFDADNDGTAASDADDNIAGNNAFGRPISIHTRPTSSGNGSLGWSWAVTPTTQRWTADLAHQYGMVHFPYLISGDPYYLEEMQFWASFDVWAPASGVTDSDSRHGSWGILVPQGWETRSMGWVIRNMSSAAYWSPDGTMEKEYFTKLLENQLAEREGFAEVRGPGFLKVTNAPDTDPCPASGGTNNGKSYNAWNKTSYDPAYSTPWCWGRKVVLSGMAGITNPLRFPATFGINESTAILSLRVNSPWMLGFVWQGLGWVKDLGYPADDLLRGSSKIALWMTTHPDWNWYRTAAYRMPMFDDGTPWASGVKLAQSLEQFQYLWDGYATGTSWGSSIGWPDGYTATWSGALSNMTGYADGGARGWDAWAWYSNPSNVSIAETWAMDYPGSSNFQHEYKHSMQPRIRPVRPTVKPADTSAVFTYLTPAENSSCTVDGVSDGQTGRARRYIKTGLSASTSYQHVVNCTDDPHGSTTMSYVTRPVLTGPALFSVRVGGGSTTAYLEHGPTAALGTTEDPVACSSGCELTATVAKGPRFYRVHRGDVAGNIEVSVVQ